MKLLLVHGIAQRGKDPKLLCGQWTEAFSEGLVRAGIDPPGGISVAFAFYAEDLGYYIDQIERRLPSDLTARGPGSGDVAVLAQTQRELMQAVLDSVGVDGAEVSRELGSLQARDPQNWGWVLAASRVLSRVPGLDNALIDRFLKEVSVYMTIPAARERVDEVVAAALGDDAAVVVGHSLGSVVSYNVLRGRNEPGVQAVSTFVTVGSPLAIPGVKSRLTSPLTFPRPASEWFNAYDPTDIVALFPLDTKHFNVRPEIVNFGGVRNFTSNRHGITGYLSDPTVAKFIASALS